MAVRFSAGGVLRVPLADDRFAYAVMLEVFPYIAFYPAASALNDQRPPGESPLFILMVERGAYSRDGWGPILFRLDKKDLPSIPLFFWQDVVDPNQCTLVDPLGNEREVSPAECIDLERVAVWAADHVEGRLEDYYAGRPNVTAESLRVELG
ncbi:hypothetical protein [Actinopolymorpha pittospori]|uniref:Uncharacterized protein n=1 Tax=Actinopolymorpha pittospori TaxID=648752 RepID=A0A927MSN7_9ACTN|nr:hypothetical protein [Actinopolymorpha pittospori]MBE1605587.1 hypothetical protein [Actinopolymorpha pittospori]